METSPDRHEAGPPTADLPQTADPAVSNAQVTPELRVAILAGGCFWCLEAVYKDLRGVRKVIPGYIGGQVESPRYEQVCGGKTGHAEAVAIEYDPSDVGYDDLLRVFFTIHDPTTKDRQGNDIGPQYRSGIFYLSDEERATAERVMAEIETAGIWPGRLVTELTQATRFWIAEAEHHDYFERNPYTGYCRVVVAPKVSKFRKMFADRLKSKAA